MKKNKTRFALVLHAHLPYVLNHGTWPHGTDWLFEAASETYIPLLHMLDDLHSENIPSPLTLNITPILCEQFTKNEFKNGYKDYLLNKIKNAIDDGIYFKKIGEGSLLNISEFWEKFYRNTLEYFESINCDLLSRFKSVQDRGQIEIITCAATHGYFPLLGTDEAIRGQVGTAVDAYFKYFKRKPKGIWLPENAYRPAYKWRSPLGGKAFQRKGVEEILSEFGIRYFFVDTHLIQASDPVGVYLERFKALQNLWKQFESQYTEISIEKELSPYYPYLVHENDINPVYAIVRDEKTGTQVWSAQFGYPGDPNYLEFHKKKFPGGHKYWKVTGANVSLGDKLEYNVSDAFDRIRSHAEHFCDLLESITKQENSPPQIVALYDAELFGHWWFEGIKWIEHIFRGLNSKRSVMPDTAFNCLNNTPVKAKVNLPEGSWGRGGFHYIWLNESTKWSWKHIYEAEETLTKNIRKMKNGCELSLRILKQMARELLLMESSDWQFLISTWSARDYAENRITFHWENFSKLNDIYKNFLKNDILKGTERSYLIEIESIDDVFEDIDLDYWK